MDTVTFESHSGLGIGSFGETVSAESASLAARRPMAKRATVRSMMSNAAYPSLLGVCSGRPTGTTVNFGPFTLLGARIVVVPRVGEWGSRQWELVGILQVGVLSDPRMGYRRYI